MRILIAPDKFKGTLSARAAAEAMARGARRAGGSCGIGTLPLADGGEGTMDALMNALGGRVVSAEVTAPDGRRLRGAFALLGDGRAVVEMAAGAGLGLVPEERRDALRATSRGAGDLVRAALDRGASEVVFGVGGSASTDGGTGAASALGWRFLDRTGREVGRGGAALTRLARIDAARVDARVRACRVVGACDVGNPLIGPEGAARVFGPQKGARPRDVERLEEGLAALADRVRADLGLDVATRWGAGAGGGMGAGLIAFFGASLETGAELVARAAGLEARLASHDVVLTGEGRLDAQSLGGKVPVAVARAARARGVPCYALAGETALDERARRAAGFAGVASLADRFGAALARREASACLEEAACRLVARLTRGEA